MLQVRIENIDQTFIGVFNGNWSGNGPATAVQRALDDLIKNHKFFEDNRVYELSDAERKAADTTAFGILLLDGDAAEEEFDNENTYWIFVSEVKLDMMIEC